MTQPFRATHGILVGPMLAFLVAAGACTSLGNPNSGNPNAPETAFTGNAGVKISIPPDRPNACPRQVNVYRLVQDAKKNGLDFTACNVACLSLSGEVVNGQHDGRFFGRCDSPNGSSGFGGMLVPTPGAPDGTYEVEQITFITGPKTSAPELTLAR